MNHRLNQQRIVPESSQSSAEKSETATEEKMNPRQDKWTDQYLALR